MQGWPHGFRPESRQDSLWQRRPLPSQN
ncbi:rCG47567 [Rattus norvegicus]|uniref:RCG47567 n=1 Tax=Rattus norvegicus TaxID=10116 RepID=A6HYK2_RAT|nr:rCG47567 [Rattus norvegicus]